MAFSKVRCIDVELQSFHIANFYILQPFHMAFSKVSCTEVLRCQTSAVQKVSCMDVLLRQYRCVTKVSSIEVLLRQKSAV